MSAFRRTEQLNRWEHSEANNVSPTIAKDKKKKIKFSDNCVFLAACSAGDTEEVESLLEKGTDINATSVDGLTGLHQACIDNNLEMVQLLVEHGCDVNRGDHEGWTPLHAASSCGFISIVKYLIEHRANVAAINEDGDLPIDIAATEKMRDYLSDVLDEQGINYDDAKSEEERIMLEDAMQLLNSNNFQDRIHPRTGATALHVAAAKNYVKVVNILIQAGADLNAQDNDGWTPFHAAAHWGKKEICVILADNLANMDIQNFAGQTCFDVADNEIADLLGLLKKKQVFIQNDRSNIQVIPYRTSSRPLANWMNNQEKSSVIMKDNKTERAEVENMTFPEKQKKRKQNEFLEQMSRKDENVIEFKTGPLFETEPPELPKESETKKISSWENMFWRNSENIESRQSKVTEITLKEPLKSEENNDKNCRSRIKNEENDLAHLYLTSYSTEAIVETSNDSIIHTISIDTSSESLSQERRPLYPPDRDGESELQRKARAKRIRETRRSTRRVLLENINSAKFQILINKQKRIEKQQAHVTETDSVDNENNSEKEKYEKIQEPESLHKNENATPEAGFSRVSNTNKNKVLSKSDNNTKKCETTENPSTVTLVSEAKSTSYPDKTKPTNNQATSLGAPSGRIYQFGTSTSIPYSASKTSSRGKIASHDSSLGSSDNLNDGDDKDYKKLYEELRNEHLLLKENFMKAEEERKRLKSKNERLRTEESVLIRVISKLCQYLYPST